jgi:hypothetical protein
MALKPSSSIKVPADFLICEVEAVDRLATFMFLPLDSGKLLVPPV